MICDICGHNPRTDDVDALSDLGWFPSYYLPDGGDEVCEPICERCVERFIVFDEDSLPTLKPDAAVPIKPRPVSLRTYFDMIFRRFRIAQTGDPS